MGPFNGAILMRYAAVIATRRHAVVCTQGIITVGEIVASLTLEITRAAPGKPRPARLPSRQPPPSKRSRPSPVSPALLPSRPAQRDVQTI